MMTPIDVVKTRIQLEPAMGKLGMAGTARSIIASEGPKGLLTGFGATAVGYLVQVSTSNTRLPLTGRGWERRTLSDRADP